MRDLFANSVVQESNEVNAKQDYQENKDSVPNVRRFSIDVDHPVQQKNNLVAGDNADRTQKMNAHENLRFSINIDDDLGAVFDDELDAPSGGLKGNGIRGEDVLKEGEEALGSIHISAADTARPVQQSVFDGETADMRDKMRARYNERMIIARKDLRQQRHAEHCARGSRSIKAFRSF